MVSDADGPVQANASKPGWLAAGSSVAVLLVLVLVFYGETTRHVMAVWSQWETGEYAHGYLVLAMSLFMVYTRRKVLASLVPCPSYPALAVVLLCSLAWLAGTAADVQLVQTVALLCLLMAVIWTTLGTAIARQLLLPVLFLGVAMPVWSPLSPLLQELTADVVYHLARLAEIPALRQENLIILPSGRLSVERSCSGMRYLLAALVLGVLYGDLYYRSLRARVVVLLIAACTAILANILRVFIVVWLAHRSAMQHPWVADHLALGWFLFGGLVFVLLAIDIGLSRYRRESREGEAPAAPPGSSRACQRGLPGHALALVLAAVLAASGPAFAWWAAASPSARQAAAPDFPTAAGGWSGPSVTRDSWMPVFHGASADRRVYRKGGTEVYLYLGRYAEQSQGRELINELNSIGNPEWRTVYSDGRDTAPAGMPVLEQVLVGTEGRKRLVWYWYEVAGRETTSDYMAKFLQVLGRLTGRPQAAIVAMATPIEYDSAAAQNVLADFLSLYGKLLVQTASGH
jgi:exosortase A